MANFSNIKVGDKIKYYPRLWGDFPHFATVTKVTPKQFEDSKKVRFLANLMVCALAAVTLIVQLRQKKILPSLTDVSSEKKC